MIQIYCKTNLDLPHCEKWPKELPSLPRVGDHIESGHKWPNGFVLRLRVWDVTWEHHDGQWVPRVELHMPGLFNSIRSFYEWYAPCIGKSVSAFL